MKRLLLILFVSVPLALSAQEYADTALFQGANLKLDLGNSVFEPLRSKGDILSFEGSLNFDVMHRFFPTLDLGYAQSDLSAASGSFRGKGGFARIGMDLSALKKRREMNMLLVGLRVGTAVQGCSTRDVVIGNGYWGYSTENYLGRVRADVWGEVVAGLQVQVYRKFHMGWYVRYKILFSRGKNGAVTAYYIPGYGYKQDTNFSFNYFIGFKL